MTTSNVSKTQILAQLWIDYREDPKFAGFIKFNDVSLPLAYAIDNDIVPSTDKAMAFIDETFGLLLAALKIEDTGFYELEEVLEQAG